jgi:hypothetical protein
MDSYVHLKDVLVCLCCWDYLFLSYVYYKYGGFRLNLDSR